ncbi:MAG: ArsR family transcriptional regulator [Acidobacteria bacterium]|nr:MAG: ArsR family transcriptional regulator [Acidobacteriota bacterium]
MIPKEHLDEIDCKILDVLQHEGRISTLDLAERVGLSPTPCARRVKRLEELGVIEGYVAVLNPKALGVGLNVFVNVRLRSSTRNAIETFEQAIKDMPEVVECYLVTGNYDYLLHLRLADVDMFKDFVRERLTNIASVGETLSSIALEQTKFTTAIALRPGQ